MRRVRRFGTVGTVLSMLLGTLTVFAQDTPRLYWTGTFGGSRSEARGVSGDGSVVVGWTMTAGSQRRAFRWTRDEGLQDLGSLGGNLSEAYAVSRNGRVVVGISTTAQGGFSQPFRWSAETGMQPLGTLYGQARGVSGDGSIILANLAVSSLLVAHRWTEQGGYERLVGFPTSALDTVATSITPDGVAIAGYYRDTTNRFRPFLWRNGTVETLPTPISGVAFGITDDGTIVVGRVEIGSPTDSRPARWRNNQLEILNNSVRGVALATNRDGTLIVGSYATPQGERAFLWSEQAGWIDLNQRYASLLGDAILLSATGITPDGRFIVGYGLNPETGITEGFMIDTIPEPSTLVVLGFGLGAMSLWRRKAPN